MSHRRVIIKIGTNVIAKDNGLLDHVIIEQIVDQICTLKSEGVEIILVSSGAMGAGRTLVKLSKKINEVARRQVLASVGQSRLMSLYDALFEKRGYLSAQVLATKEDFRDRHHYLNMKSCIEALLTEGVVPIVNENDVTSITKVMFTDNDELAGLLSSMLQADALYILSSVDGVWNDKGQVISSIKSNQSIHRYIKAEKSSFGRGGMLTKCHMSQKVAKCGIETHIANGKTPNIILDLYKNKKIGTTFEPQRKISCVKQWIAHTEGQEKGKVWVNKGGVEVLQSDKVASLLPVGITKMEGRFAKGDIIKIMSFDNKVVGLGVAQYSYKEADALMGQRGAKPLVHYNYLIIN